MRSYTVPALVIILALGIAACSEDTDRQPTAPDLHTVTGPTSECDFTHIRQLATSYFGPPLPAQVRNTLDAMATAFSADDYSTTVKERGFDVLKQIDNALNGTSPTTGATTGSDLVNHLILCMYDPATEAASYPSPFPESFEIPLTPAANGAFSVRPPGPSEEVYSRPFSSPFSGISVTSAPWANTLSANTPQRVLFYGHPGSTLTFDWKTLPRNATFAPDIVIGICLSADDNTTTLLNDEHVGLLPFEDATFLNPLTCSPTSATLLRNPFMFAGRLLRSVLSPEPLMAAAFSPGGVGGRTSGIGTEYGPSEVNNVTLSMGNQPVDGKVGLPICGGTGTPCPVPVTVLATASLVAGGTDGIPNTEISVTAVNNNGAKVRLGGTTTVTTDADGVAEFDDLTLNKTGAYQLVFEGNVLGRPAINVLSVTSAKFIEAPAK